ncbi:MAG: branched-chain amino acid ABC transporter permease [OCS116 cluster bacterium]|nr:branched-chain amino acid ABC transporter permease [OCS116 cluster bacterium]
MNFIELIIQGILLGGLYALFAAGLSLIFGIMRLVNIAHGDFIILSAYIAYLVISYTGVHPFIALLLVIPIMSMLGYMIQRYILNRTMGDDILPPLLVTFGLAVIIQNTLLTTFSTNTHRLTAGDIDTASVGILDMHFGLLPILTFFVAIIIIFGLELLFSYTKIGRAFRATSDDREMASAIGINTKHVFAMAMALCFCVISVAGVLLAIRSSFDPFSGPARLIYGFEAVIIGGLGSLWGTLVGGIILGIAQIFGAHISPSFQILAGHLAFFIILAVRPKGLFSKVE